jgi:hypothetical protein
MLTLNSKYNFTVDVSDNLFSAFHTVSNAKGLPVSVYLQSITKLTAIVENSTNPMLRDSTKVWVNLGDYSIQMKKSDYDTVNKSSKMYHGQPIDEYLQARVCYW